jgi:hypothetical protein
VIEATPVNQWGVNTEIWRITCSAGLGDEVQTFWVLAETGETLGHPPSNPFPADENTPPFLERPSDFLPLRTDWSAYISSLAASNDPPVKLINRVRWTNSEDYTNGISNHWLKMIERHPTPLRLAEKKVAERYILANVTGNRYDFTHVLPLSVD